MAPRPALAKMVREWWPELLFAAFMALFLLMRSKDGALFVGFETIIGAVCWSMGFRHRDLPHHKRVREIWETTRRIEDRGLGEPGPQDAGRPLARIVPLRRR